MLGGFKAQGRSAEKALALLADARALEAAGCFSLVLEAVPAPVARRVSERLAIPRSGSALAPRATARCSSGTTCSGCTRGAPPASSSAGSATSSAPRSRATSDVRERRFPEEQHTYAMPKESFEVFERALDAGREAESWL